MAAIFMLVATVLITVGMRLISSNAKESRQREVFLAQAENVARAGLVDALGWFRRQGISRAFSQAYPPGSSPITYAALNGVTLTYPDQAFWPVKNTSNAQLSDTIDATLGIVNEYPLDSQNPSDALFWARYEIQRQAVASPLNTLAAHDISGNRNDSQMNGDGTIWYITCIGYIYRRTDLSISAGTLGAPYFYWIKDYKTPPNQVVAKVSISTEYRKLGLNLPTLNESTATGAVYCEKVPQVKLINNQTLLNGAVTAGTNFSVVSMKYSP